MAYPLCREDQCVINLPFMEPLSDEVILAAVREHARITSVQAGPTAPDARAVLNYSRVQSILVALAAMNVERFLATQNGQPFAETAEGIAAVERHREEILRSDPKLAQMLARMEARLRERATREPVQRAKQPRRPKPSAASSISPSAETPEPASSARPAIGYVTPKGKPHYFRAKTIEQVWQRLEQFFRGCTDVDPLQPMNGTLNFAETAAALENPRVMAALEKAREQLGASAPTPWTGLGILFPELATATGSSLFTGGVQHRWDVKPGRAEVAVELMLAGDPWPNDLMPIASLTMLHRFRWTRTGRDGDDVQPSTCITHLAPRSALTPMFLFPFETADDRFLDYLAEIRGLLPVPLSAKNFRLMEPTSRGATLVPRLFDTSAIDKVLAPPRKR